VLRFARLFLNRKGDAHTIVEISGTAGSLVIVGWIFAKGLSTPPHR
jgi:hypothetical protein